MSRWDPGRGRVFYLCSSAKRTSFEFLFAAVINHSLREGSKTAASRHSSARASLREFGPWRRLWNVLGISQWRFSINLMSNMHQCKPQMCPGLKCIQISLRSFGEKVTFFLKFKESESGKSSLNCVSVEEPRPPLVLRPGSPELPKKEARKFMVNPAPLPKQILIRRL